MGIIRTNQPTTKQNKIHSLDVIHLIHHSFFFSFCKFSFVLSMSILSHQNRFTWPLETLRLRIDVWCGTAFIVQSYSYVTIHITIYSTRFAWHSLSCLSINNGSVITCLALLQFKIVSCYCAIIVLPHAVTLTDPTKRATFVVCVPLFFLYKSCGCNKNL